MEDRLREMLREHERTYHAALPGGVAASPEGWSTVGFVALISRAVARAVEVAIRVHRESSQLHRLEDGQARGFDARILAGTADRMPQPLLPPALGSPEWVDLYRN